MLSTHYRHWSRLGLIATGFGLLALLASLADSDVDTRDRLLQVRFEGVVREATTMIQDRVAEHDRLLGELALQFNHLGSGTDVRFVEALAEHPLRERFPAVTRLGYMTLDATGRLRTREFEPDAQPESAPVVPGHPTLATLERPLAYSRDFDSLALSPVVPLGVATGQGDTDRKSGAGKPAVMLFKPVYDDVTVGPSRGSRRLHHRGWVYAVIDTSRLLSGLEQSALGPLDISIYDGLSQQSEETLLFGSHRGIDRTGRYAMQSIRPVGLASRAWTQVARLDQGDAVTPAPPAESSWVPRALFALTGLATMFWLKGWWRRQQGQREDTRAF